jgi:hypothetical protein
MTNFRKRSENSHALISEILPIPINHYTPLAVVSRARKTLRVSNERIEYIEATAMECSVQRSAVALAGGGGGGPPQNKKTVLCRFWP